jgi:hypothetical protein
MTGLRCLKKYGMKILCWIQRLCGSGSVLGIRIRIGNPDPEARKLRNFSRKMHFSYFLKKFYHLKGTYKIALTTFWTKFRWINPIFFVWFYSKFLFKKIWERNCLRKFCFSLDPDPDPDWAKMLDPDPDPDWAKCWIRIRIKSIRIHNPGWMGGVEEGVGEWHWFVFINLFMWQGFPFWSRGICAPIMSFDSLSERWRCSISRWSCRSSSHVTTKNVAHIYFPSRYCTQL